VAIVLITVAPVSLAILAISPLLTLLNPIHPASTIYFEAKSSIPILVRITLAPAWRILLTLYFKTSHYFCLIFSIFLGSSTKTWIPNWSLNLFKLKSRQAIFAFLISVGICWWALTVWIAYPLTNWLYVELCPWALRILIDLTGYLTPKIVYCLTALIESTTKPAKNSGSALINLEDIEVLAQLSKAYSPKLSTVTESLSSIYRQAYLAAIL